ncbi:hypothetical protein [Saccharopolyspora phatthalungensis]|uniref:Uncharacterized protein n=1 Tax=Saccharopolyspora phatthalungensis TaxID=664693 RepID=A0A840Q956_9PSEU|nr:hypothetical protein [Saccharopolyspora phatthalungensis]MBB5157294.1 hypothetical protein [Saccharopolyspora phatthalungensis]
MQAELRALHGCLTTGALLLAPARDGLHRLGTHEVTVQQARATMTEDHALAAPADEVPICEAADHDVAGQRRPARPEPTDDQDPQQDLDGVGEVLEADPADIADQRRDAPVLDETEPWP